MHVPFSPASERNKQPILEVLQSYLADPVRDVLEIGSGTAQHAVFFAKHFKHLHWHTSDLLVNHTGIMARLTETHLKNVHAPILLDVAGSWPDRSFDAIFTANTAHIMAWPEVICMVQGTARSLLAGGRFIIYGPFKIDGEFTSASNRQFDSSLREASAHRAIRDLESLQSECEKVGLRQESLHQMPANNLCVVFSK